MYIALRGLLNFDAVQTGELSILYKSAEVRKHMMEMASIVYIADNDPSSPLHAQYLHSQTTFMGIHM